MNKFLLVAALLATSLAGCAEEPAPVEEEVTAADEELQATDSTGVIRGVVVDPSITPIVGATITIGALGIEATSLEDGSFGFGDLEPGGYFLEVSKIGYTTVQSSATVEAGVDKPEVVRIQLVEDFESLPFTTLEVFDGYLQCGVGFGLVGLSTNPCAFTGSVNVFDAGAGADLNMTQLEMHWKGTNILGDGLSLGLLRPGTISNFAGADGPSPLVLPVGGDQIRSEYGPELEGFTMRVFPGTNQELSVVLEQRFEIFTTNFYGFGADEGWSFIEDGEHEIPA